MVDFPASHVSFPGGGGRVDFFLPEISHKIPSNFQGTNGRLSPATGENCYRQCDRSSDPRFSWPKRLPRPKAFKTEVRYAQLVGGFTPLKNMLVKLDHFPR